MNLRQETSLLPLPKGGREKEGIGIRNRLFGRGEVQTGLSFPPGCWPWASRADLLTKVSNRVGTAAGGPSCGTAWALDMVSSQVLEGASQWWEMVFLWGSFRRERGCLSRFEDLEQFKSIQRRCWQEATRLPGLQKTAKASLEPRAGHKCQRRFWFSGQDADHELEPGSYWGQQDLRGDVRSVRPLAA